MAKRKKKSGKKKSGHRKNAKRSRAAKRAYKKSGLYAYNMKKKRKGGGRKKGYGKKKGKKKGGKKGRSYAAKKSSFHGGAVAARARFNNLVKRFEAKGYDEKTAVGLAHRAVRMGKAMGRGKAKHVAGVAAQQQAMANLFGGIAAAGQLEAMRR